MSAKRWLIVVCMLPLLIAPSMARAASPEGGASHARSVDRGRYLVRISGCNDCHTPGYAESGGQVPESRWLVGSPLGWRGPWGTTYPPNLRLFMQTLSEDQWLALARTTRYRPPMPWFALHGMTTSDLRAIYRFVRALGPAGQKAPDFVPPEQQPRGPFVQFPAPPPASASAH